MAYQPLRGQKALVTGASSGIGRGVAQALGAAGADVVVNYVTDPQAARDIVDAHPGQTVIGDKNYFGRAFEDELTERDLVLLRPVRKGEAKRAGQQFFRPLRQVVESVNWTLKGQLDLEQHGGRTPEGILARVLARVLALTAAIWHNDKLAQPVMRSLTAYDH